MKHNWEYKKLGEVCETTSGGTPSKIKLEYYTNGNIPWLRSGEIRQGLIFDTDIYITEEGLKHSSAKIIPINSVVIAMYGATVGQCGIIKSKMCTNQAVCSIFPNSNIIPEFLCLFLTSKKNTFIKSAVGGAQPNISQNIVRNTLIPLPPLSVQERIVEELDRLSLILEKKKQQIKELDSLAQSIFYDMFGDPIENEKGWEVKKLGEICSDKQHIIRANKYFSKTAKIQYIDISSINNSSNTITNTTTFVFENAPSRAQQKVEYGDVLISLVRPNLKNIASIDIMCNNLVASSGFCVLRGINVSQYYIKALVLTNHFTKYLTERVSGANYPAIHEEDIKNCIIGIPPLDLQQSFAKKIEAIEKQKELINQSIKEVQLLFDAKMDYYFGD